MNDAPIPDDIMKMAIEVLIADATAKERERCAKVCEAMTWFKTASPKHVVLNGPADYAAAIRSPAKEGSTCAMSG